MELDYICWWILTVALSPKYLNRRSYVLRNSLSSFILLYNCIMWCGYMRFSNKWHKHVVNNVVSVYLRCWASTPEGLQMNSLEFWVQRNFLNSHTVSYLFFFFIKKLIIINIPCSNGATTVVKRLPRKLQTSDGLWAKAMTEMQHVLSGIVLL